MSRIANSPVEIPKGVEITLKGQNIAVKGPKGQLTHDIHRFVSVKQEENTLQVIYDPESVAISGSKGSKNTLKTKVTAIAGTTRALINNIVQGVSTGFEKKLKMVGVGYRAQVQGNKINISAGFSHPVVFLVPEGITVESPSQTELVIKGVDKQQVGQVAANIRRIRPPEPYKGKGIRYSDEHVSLKETKKK